MVKKKLRIVILGAGFAGLRVAQDLPKMLKGALPDITLVDRSDVHLYTPDLYEIASAFNEKMDFACLVKLKDTVATPLRDLVNPSEVNLLHDWVTGVDPKKKKVLLKRSGELPYDILVVALGSTPAYFNIPGLEEHAYSLKTVRDALAINANLDHQFLQRRSPNVGRNRRPLAPLHVAVGGGGAAGVELTGELSNCLDRLCNKYRFPRSKVHLHLIEGQGELAGSGPRGTALIAERFKRERTTVHLNRFLTKVEKNRVRLKSPKGKKEVLPCSFLIWTGGVQVNPVVAESLGSKEFRGAIAVDATLHSTLYPDIFAAGDNAALVDQRTGKLIPMLAQFAFLEGAVTARNVVNKIQKKPLKPARFHRPVMVLPLGGRYGFMRLGPLLLKGRRVWLLHRLISLRYAMMILPFWKAYKKWRKDTKVFIEND